MRLVINGATVRVLVVVSAAMAVLGTWIAAGRTLLVLDVAIVLLAVVTAVFPDRHIGLAVLMLIGISWWATVDDVATPWSVGVAIAVTIFHACAAAASVAPTRAVWSRTMISRWGRRTLVLIGASVGTWVVVSLLHNTTIGVNAPLVAGALMVIAISVVTLRALPSQPSESSS